MEAITVNTNSIGPLTNDQLFHLCQENPNLRIERKANGQLIFMTPTGGYTGKINSYLITELNLWARKNGEGIVFDSSTGFLLPDHSMLSPDVSWLKKEIWKSLSQEDKEKFPPVCPDFVIELRSKSDSLPELKKKMNSWIKNGVQSAWLIDPVESRAYIYKPDQEVAVFENFEVKISDEEVLPGFFLDLSEIKH